MTTDSSSAFLVSPRAAVQGLLDNLVAESFFFLSAPSVLRRAAAPSGTERLVRPGILGKLARLVRNLAPCTPPRLEWLPQVHRCQALETNVMQPGVWTTAPRRHILMETSQVALLSLTMWQRCGASLLVGLCTPR